MVKLNHRERNCSYMHEKWIREDVSVHFNWWIACLLAKQLSLLPDSIFHPVCGLLSQSLAFPAVCETSSVWLVITVKSSFCADPHVTQWFLLMHHACAFAELLRVAHWWKQIVKSFPVMEFRFALFGILVTLLWQQQGMLAYSVFLFVVLNIIKVSYVLNLNWYFLGCILDYMI